MAFKVICAARAVCGNINCEHAETHEYDEFHGCSNNAKCECLERAKQSATPEEKERMAVVIPACEEVKKAGEE